MKFFFPFIVFAANVFFANAQQLSATVAAQSKIKSQREITYSAKDEQKDTVQSIRIFNYDEKGNCTNAYEYISAGRKQMKVVFSFDEKGNIEECDSVDGDGKIFSKSFYNYDEKGKLLTIKTQDTSGNLLLQFVFTYNPNGKPAEKKCTDALGKLISKETYKYDATATLIQCDYYNADSKINMSDKFSAEGKLVDQKTFDADGIIFSRLAISYDFSGNKAAEVITDAKGNVTKRSSFTCGPFVGPGLWIKQTEFDPNGKAVIIIEKDFEFYPQ